MFVFVGISVYRIFLYIWKIWLLDLIFMVKIYFFLILNVYLYNWKFKCNLNVMWMFYFLKLRFY